MHLLQINMKLVFCLIRKNEGKPPVEYKILCENRKQDNLVTIIKAIQYKVPAKLNKETLV